MASPKYPLQPLLEHREHKVDVATTQLGQAIEKRAAAEGARVRAEAARRDAEARAAEVKAAEARRLEHGELRVLDLVQGAAWAASAEANMARLAEVEAGAARREAGAREAEALAQRTLAGETADRDVVAKDAALFEARAKARGLAAEEEASLEAFRPRGDR